MHFTICLSLNIERRRIRLAECYNYRILISFERCLCVRPICQLSAGCVHIDWGIETLHERLSGSNNVLIRRRKDMHVVRVQNVWRDVLNASVGGTIPSRRYITIPEGRCCCRHFAGSVLGEGARTGEDTRRTVSKDGECVDSPYFLGTIALG